MHRKHLMADNVGMDDVHPEGLTAVPARVPLHVRLELLALLEHPALDHSTPFPVNIRHILY